jgi:hypothetical protein
LELYDDESATLVAQQENLGQDHGRTWKYFKSSNAEKSPQRGSGTRTRRQGGISVGVLRYVRTAAGSRSGLRRSRTQNTSRVIVKNPGRGRDDR